MADKNVSMTLTVDAKSVEAATAAQKKLTQEVVETGKAADKTKKSIAQLADERIAKIRQEQAIQKQIQASAPDLARGGGGAAGGPGGRPGGGGGGGFQAGGFASLVGIGAAFSGLNHAISFTQQNANNPGNLTAGNFFNEAARGLPLVGGLAGILEDTIGGQVGYSNRTARREGGIAAEFAAQQGERTRRIQDLQAGERSQQAELRRQQYEASSGAAAATRFREGLGEARGGAASFNTKYEFGVSNEQSGQLRLDKLAAESQLFGAQRQASLSGADVDAAKRRREELQREVRDAAGASYAAEQREAQARKRQETGKSFLSLGNNAKLDDDVASSTGQAAQARQALINKQNELAKQGFELQKLSTASAADQKRVAEDRYQISLSQIAIEKNELAILKEKQAALKAGAIQFAGQDEGTKQATIEAAKKLKAGQFGDLTDEERGLVQGNALTRRLYEQEAERFGRQDPATQELARIAGFDSPQKTDADVSALATKITEDTAKANEEFRKEIAAVVSNSVKELGETFRLVLVDTIQQINTQMNDARLLTQTQSVP